MSEKEKISFQSILQRLLQTNKWKVAFFTLLAVLIGTCGFIFFRITEKRELVSNDIPPLVERAGSPVLSIQSNKEQINRLIGFYLQEYQQDSDVTYEFILQNEALLKGEMEILGFPISFYLYFDPYIMDNGNVQLKATSLSIGTLGVPINEVMKMIERNTTLPTWIEIDPDEEVVMLRLDQFRMQNGLFIKADRINLVEDEIKVSLYLPEEQE